MHAVVVQVTIEDESKALPRLERDVVPRVSGAPGFIAGYWVRVSAEQGTSTVVFESESAAQAVADQMRQRAGDEEGVNFDRIEVGEVVAHA